MQSIFFFAFVNSNMKDIYAFIDGQNLHQGITRALDYKKFRIYLRDKYKVSKAYYFLWFQDKENSLYETLQEAWFILVFNLKGEHLKSSKKWNVDTNIVFHMMKKLIEWTMQWALLVSGDGDYKMVVDYLVEKRKLNKVLCPNLRFASSLYRHAKNLDPKFFDYIDKSDIKKKISYIKKAP